MNIDWQSESTEVLLNPRLSATDRDRIYSLINQIGGLKGHLWISTSGSTGTLKWAALSKSAIIASANAVNRHLNCTSDDCWIHPLPDYHVGGIGIWARSHLSGSRVIDYKKRHGDKWDAEKFHRMAYEEKATLTALVPAQMYDLVAARLHSPISMRAVIIGGGSIEQLLYDKAIDLGWKLLPSYGLTECSSQVATAQLGCWESGSVPELKILPHVNVAIDEEGFINIKSHSLLTGYVFESVAGESPKFVDPKSDGWFRTEDLGKIVDGNLIVLGRSNHFVKIGGESVDLKRLENIFESHKLNLGIIADMALVAVSDPRLGHVIHLASTIPEKDIKVLIERYQTAVFPFERIRQVHVVESIPRTPLHKLRMQELLKVIDSRL